MKLKNQKERLETKHKILKLFGINVIAIKDVKEYNSDFYSLCLKEIKEDMEKNCAFINKILEIL